MSHPEVTYVTDEGMFIPGLQEKVVNHLVAKIQAAELCLKLRVTNV